MENIVQVAIGIAMVSFLSWAAWVTKQIFSNKREDCIIISRIEQKLDDFIKRYDEHLK